MPNIEFRFKCHPSQALVRDDPARFKILAAGRRWGKTRLGVMLCYSVALAGGKAWWVSPSYRMSSVGWEPAYKLANKAGFSVRVVDRQITLPNGGSISIRSADNPDSLRGDGLDFVVLDECAFIHPDAWYEALRPALSDKLGGALFISTPKGRNWFWKLYTLGQAVESHDCASWDFPTSDNPYILPSEIEAAKSTLPERVFRQEYMAEFIEDSGSVFRNIKAAATVEHSVGPKRGSVYIFGVDWGKVNDFMVITVLDATRRELVHIDRFNMVSYKIQAERLRSLYNQYRPVTIIAEANAMGEPMIDTLRGGSNGLPIAPFYTTAHSKTNIIDDLALAFEQGTLRIIPDKNLIGELEAYTAKRLPQGRLQYSAPEGMHDDCVMSLAIAWHGLLHGGRAFLSRVVYNPVRVR